MAVYDTKNKREYDAEMKIAHAQERVVNKLYIEYHGKAQAVAKLYHDNGNEVPDRKSPEYKEYAKALVAKQDAHIAWQREAHRHGAMFVELKQNNEAAERDQNTVW